MAGPNRPLGKLAVFGSFSEHDLYQRNRTLVETLERLAEQSLRIRPHKDRAGEGFSDRRPPWRRLLSLCEDALSLWRQRALLKHCDTVFVPYPAYLDLLLLKLAGALRGRRVIVDAFLELHSTVVDDRKLFAAGSLRARLLLQMQRFTLSQADIVLIDTPQQAQLLRARLGGREPRIEALPVGIDERQWQPLEPPLANTVVNVLFWGTFIPLHGVATIVAAARLLQGRDGLRIRLIGDGQTAEGIATTLASSPPANLRWDRELVDTQALRAALAEAHIVLGVFGGSAKAGAVVPYKVHQALASNRPVITRDGPALSNLMSEDLGLILCAAETPSALADAIERTAQRLRAGWTPSTRRLYDANFSTATIHARALKLFEDEAEAPASTRTEYP